MILDSSLPGPLRDFFRYSETTLPYKSAFDFTAHHRGAAEPVYREFKTGTGLPWMKLNLSGLPEKFPAQEILKEARAIESEAVPHRAASRNDSYGWKSLCLHGIDPEKTESASKYGYAGERSAPYHWTEVSEKCPTTAAYFKYVFPHTKYQRLRFMYLEPGGFITPHEDVLNEPPHFTAINIALNHPKECYFLMGNEFSSSQQRWGMVPFAQGGDAFWLDLRNYHSVVNLSEETRIHMIVHSYIDDEKDYLRFEPLLPRSIEQSHGGTQLSPESNITKREVRKGKFSFALWDTSEIGDTEEVVGHYNQFSRRFMPSMNLYSSPSYESRSIDQILNWACNETQTDFLVVIASSCIIHESEDFWRRLNDLVDQDSRNIFAWAHIIDRGEERGVGLHEQTFVVNLKLYRQHGSFVFGLPESHEQKRSAWTRSEEAVNEDYTPKYLLPKEGVFENRPSTYGWKLIDDALQAGFKIHNFPDGLRETKIFGYPEDNNHILKNYLRGDLRADSDFPKELEQGQYEYLSWLRRFHEEAQKTVWVYNNESWHDIPPAFLEKPFAGQILPASGGADYYYYAQLGHSEFQTVVFDISQSSINFHQAMREQLREGTPFEGWMSQYIKNHSDALWNEMRPRFAHQDFDQIKLSQKWTEYCESHRYYLQANIIDDYEKVLAAMTSRGPLLVNLSNIYVYLPWLWRYEQSKLVEKYRSFLTSLRADFPGSVLIGKTPLNENLNFVSVEKALEKSH